MNAWEGAMALNPGLATQALARTLSDAEAALARDLEAVFSEGVHEFAMVAAGLQSRGTKRPSGETGPWTEAVLHEELVAVNAALDAAYAADGIGA
jgi:hypothetical protein